MSIGKKLRLSLSRKKKKNDSVQENAQLKLADKIGNISIRNGSDRDAHTKMKKRGRFRKRRTKQETRTTYNRYSTVLYCIQHPLDSLGSVEVPGWGAFPSFFIRFYLGVFQNLKKKVNRILYIQSPVLCPQNRPRDRNCLSPV